MITDYFFEGAKVRVAGCLTAPLFCANDVCEVLGLKNASVVVGSLDEDERSKFNLGRQGEGWFVTESGLYHLIFKSRKSAAAAFRRWVTSEVLPALREKGFYSVLRDREFMTLPSWLEVQGVDVRKEKAEAKRLLQRAWDAGKLMGYRDRRVDERSGLVEFPSEVLALAEDGALGRLRIGGLEQDQVYSVLSKMEVGRDYGVEDLAGLGGFSGSPQKVRSEVGTLMKRLTGLIWEGKKLVSAPKRRFAFWRLEEAPGAEGVVKNLK